MKKMLSLIISQNTRDGKIMKEIKDILVSMKDIGLPYEVIVVADGELEKLRKLLVGEKNPHLRIVGYTTVHGKGYAVRYGMASAKGSIIAFFDIGVGLYVKDIAVLTHIMQTYHADIVVGSKVQRGSTVIYPWQRKLFSWGYRSLMRLLFGLSVRDTQVGLKVFDRRVLENVLPRLLVKQYAFDVEILAVAQLLGYKKIYEAPITLTFNNWLSLKTKKYWGSTMHTMWDTFAIFYRLKILKYYDGASRRKWKYDPELNFRINTG